MRAHLVLMLGFVAACGGDGAAKTDGEDSGETKPGGPPRLHLTAKQLELDGQGLSLETGSSEVADAFAERRPSATVRPQTWRVDIEPDVAAPAIVSVLAAARTSGIDLEFADRGSGDALSLTTYGPIAPGERPKRCTETSVVIGKMMTYVGLDAAEISPSGGRTVPVYDPKAGVVNFVGRPPSERCLRAPGPPAKVLESGVLAEHLEAVPSAADACKRVRLGVNATLPWSDFAPVLRRVAAAGDAIALDLGDGMTFRGCGSRAFATGPVRPMRVDQLSKKGPLTVDEIDDMLARYSEQTDACLADAPAQSLDESMEGPSSQHPVGVQLDPQGKVIELEPNDEKDPVAACIAKSASTWEFPVPRAAQPVKFTIEYAQHF